MNYKEYFSLLENGDFLGAEKCRQSSIPNKLLKFIALDGNNSENDKKKFESLRNQQIWISNISAFNDPFEFKTMFIDVEKLKNSGYSDEKIDNLKSQINSINIGVSCLSTNSFDFLPLWAYYTNNYKGFCIEYEVEKKDYLYEVLYEPKRIPVASIPVDAMNEINKKFNNKEYNQNLIWENLTLLKFNYATKSENWKHEKEVRILYELTNEYGRNVDIATLGLKASRIICGINTTQKDKEMLNNISKEIGCGNAFESVISETTYGLVESRMK